MIDKSNVFSQILTIKETFDESIFIVMVLQGLNKEYAGTISELQKKALKDLTMGDVRRALKEKESINRLNDSYMETNLAAAASHRTITKRKKDDVKDEGQTCGGKHYTYDHCCLHLRGYHTNSQCYHQMGKSNTGKPNYRVNAASIQLEDMVLLSSVDCKAGETVMVWDSGASNTLVSDEQFLVDIKELPQPVTYASIKQGETIVATHSGTLEFKININGQKRVVSIPNTQLAKGMQLNIISVGQLAQFGFTTEFKRNGATIYTDDNDIFMTATKAGIYMLQWARLTRNLMVLLMRWYIKTTPNLN